ncbi:hypothetical protein [Streptomyces cadmiisoli]|uniref:hypothetical protein n=1 Tax=Streptomyces cadmiisoli TaxID=2184053 RepID=UPI0036644F0D
MISGSGGAAHGGGTEFTAEGMEVVLREACVAAGLDPTGAELLRLGSNAVYRRRRSAPGGRDRRPSTTARTSSAA